jgi:nicotinamide-nucleotide amidase
MAEEVKLEEQVAELLKSRALSLAVAESCTGGLLSAMITSVPGSSGYFAGGVIAYSNEVKLKILGVSGTTLKEVGAVSARTAAEMAVGVRDKLSSDIGISVTGIAGPGGGTAEKPVGTVFIGFSFTGDSAGMVNTTARGYRFEGRRDEVRLKSAKAALEGLLEFLFAC